MKQPLYFKYQKWLLYHGAISSKLNFRHTIRVTFSLIIRKSSLLQMSYHKGNEVLNLRKEVINASKK